MDEKALRNARRNLRAGALLLLIALPLDLRFFSQGKISVLWLAITVACVIEMLRSYQLLQAAKGAGQPAAPLSQPAQMSRFGATAEPAASTTSRFGTTPTFEPTTGSDSSPHTSAQNSALSTSAPSAVVAVALPSPGWYPDPNGDTRWWDGGNWTEHVVPTP